MERRSRDSFLTGVTLAAGFALLGCETSERDHALRQRSPSYLFDIATPKARPDIRDDVTYVITVRDRGTSQPIEGGEGRIFARAGEEVTGTFVKAPQVGKYIGTLRFPGTGSWLVGIRFHDRPAQALELAEWRQEVRSSASSARAWRIAQPWRWSRRDTLMK